MNGTIESSTKTIVHGLADIAWIEAVACNVTVRFIDTIVQIGYLEENEAFTNPAKLSSVEGFHTRARAVETLSLQRSCSLAHDGSYTYR